MTEDLNWTLQHSRSHHGDLEQRTPGVWPGVRAWRSQLKVLVQRGPGERTQGTLQTLAVLEPGGLG